MRLLVFTTRRLLIPSRMIPNADDVSADLCHASSNLSRPRFPLYQLHSLAENPGIAEEELFLELLNDRWGPDFPASPVIVLNGMDQITARLFHRVRQLSDLANRMNYPKADPKLQQKFTNGILLLERQVIASVWSLNTNNLRQHGLGSRPRESDAVRTCARTWHCTTLTYIHMVLRQAPITSKVVEKLVNRVRLSLKILTPEELWVHFPPRFLLWVLMLAGAASVGHPEQFWLKEQLRELRLVLGLESWEDAKTILWQFAWVDQWCTKPCKKFWDQSDLPEPQDSLLPDAGQYYNATASYQRY